MGFGHAGKLNHERKSKERELREYGRKDWRVHLQDSASFGNTSNVRSKGFEWLDRCLCLRVSLINEKGNFKKTRQNSMMNQPSLGSRMHSFWGIAAVADQFNQPTRSPRRPTLCPCRSGLSQPSTRQPMISLPWWLGLNDSRAFPYTTRNGNLKVKKGLLTYRGMSDSRESTRLDSICQKRLVGWNAKQGTYVVMKKENGNRGQDCNWEAHVTHNRHLKWYLLVVFVPAEHAWAMSIIHPCLWWEFSPHPSAGRDNWILRLGLPLGAYCLLLLISYFASLKWACFLVNPNL